MSANRHTPTLITVEDMKSIFEKTAIVFLDTLLFPCRSIRSKAIDSALYRSSLKTVIRNSTPYAPSNPATKDQFQRPLEAFTTRWEKISDAITQYEARNLLDVGCAEGYMIQRAAKERGVLAVGLERDWDRVRVGRAQNELAKEYHYGIIPFAANSQSLRALPTFDIVICFSVLHHVIRHQGMEEGLNFLRSLAAATGKCFLFDMCSPEETQNDPQWGVVLDFIKADVVGKTGGLLVDAGFQNVKHIGDTPGYVAPGIRPLFICEPPLKRATPTKT